MPMGGLSAVSPHHPDQNTAPDREVANGDQEAILCDRIETAIRMGIALANQQRVRADEHAVDYGIAGLAEGTAVEVMYTLGKEPGFVNLRRRNP